MRNLILCAASAAVLVLAASCGDDDGGTGPGESGAGDSVYYPLAVVFDEQTDLMLQVLYWLLAAYAAALAVVMLWRRRSAPRA